MESLTVFDIVNVVAVVSGVLGLFSYVKSREKDNLKSFQEQAQKDEEQNKSIALLKQKVEYLDSNTKELKTEIIEKVNKVDSKVDDLKYMLIEFLAKTQK